MAVFSSARNTLQWSLGILKKHVVQTDGKSLYLAVYVVQRRFHQFESELAALSS